MEYFTQGYTAFRRTLNSKEEEQITHSHLLCETINTEIGIQRLRALTTLRDLSQQTPQIFGNLEIIRTITTLIHSTSTFEERLQCLEILENVIQATTINLSTIVPLLLHPPSIIPFLFDILHQKTSGYISSSLIVLQALIENSLHETQDILLHVPQASLSLIQLIRTKGEAIRTKTLRLLRLLSKNNQEIQKMIVFSGGFETLFDLLLLEDNLLENNSTKDSLSILHHLLENNHSTQRYFQETLDPKIFPFLLRNTQNLPQTIHHSILNPLFSIMIILCSEECREYFQILFFNDCLTLLTSLTNYPATPHAFQVISHIISHNPTLRRLLCETPLFPETISKVISGESYGLSLLEEIFLDHPEEQHSFILCLKEEYETSWKPHFLSGVSSSPPPDNLLLLLSFVLYRNPTTKIIAITIPINTEKETLLNSLLSKITGPEPTITIPFGCLLCLWLSECEESVSSLLSHSTALPLLTEILTTSKTSVCVKSLLSLIISHCFPYRTELKQTIQSRLGFRLFTRYLHQVSKHISMSTENPPLGDSIQEELQKISRRIERKQIDYISSSSKKDEKEMLRVKVEKKTQEIIHLLEYNKCLEKELHIQSEEGKKKRKDFEAMQEQVESLERQNSELLISLSILEEEIKQYQDS